MPGHGSLEVYHKSWSPDREKPFCSYNTDRPVSWLLTLPWPALFVAL